MSNKVTLLFYSRNCEDCKNLLILMKNINIVMTMNYMRNIKIKTMIENIDFNIKFV